MTEKGTSTGGLFLTFDFIEKYVRFAKPEYIRLYIYIRYRYEKDGQVPGYKDIARALGILPDEAEFIIEYWESRGEIIKDGDAIIFTDLANISSFDANVNNNGSNNELNNELNSELNTESKPKIRKRMSVKVQSDGSRSEISKKRSTKPAYSQEEIEAAAGVNKQISAMFYQAERILNKPLTESETELLYSFNDWLGLPVEVITMLLTYAANKGKTTKRYLETVAIDWADKGIDTFETAEAYITELEANDNAEAEVRKILGIYGRGLTSTERKYIKIWVNEMKITTELISLAYDRTVEYTGKLSWSYMDKLLQSWIANGYSTEAEVRAADEEYYRTKGGKGFNQKTKKNKFDNYEPTTQTNYAELEEQIWDMMLDDGFESDYKTEDLKSVDTK